MNIPGLEQSFSGLRDPQQFKSEFEPVLNMNSYNDSVNQSLSNSLKRSSDQMCLADSTPESLHQHQLALQFTQLASILQQQQQLQQWAPNLCSPSSVLPGLGSLSVNTPIAQQSFFQSDGQKTTKKFKADPSSVSTPRNISAPPATPQARVADPLTTPSRKKKSSSGAVAAKQLLETLLHTLQNDNEDSESEEEDKAPVPQPSVEPVAQPQVALMLAQLQQMQQHAHVAQQQAVLQQQLQGLLCAQLLQSSSSAASSASGSRQGSVPPSPSMQAKTTADAPVPFDSSMYSLVRLPDGSEHWVRRRQSKKNPITPTATPIAPPITPMSRTAKRNARLESLQRAANKLASRLREFETPDGLPKDDVVLHLPTPRGSKKKAPLTPNVEIEQLTRDEHAIDALRALYPTCQTGELLAHLQAHNVKIVRIEGSTTRSSKATPSKAKTPMPTPAVTVATKPIAEPVLLPFDEDNNNDFQKFESLPQPATSLDNLFLPVADSVPTLDVGSNFMLDGLMMAASPPGKNLCLSPLHSPCAPMFHFSDSISLEKFDTNCDHFAS